MVIVRLEADTMTHLQQTCADMLTSQEKLQQLFNVHRAQLAGRWPSGTLERMSVAIATARHRENLQVCGQCLQRHPAANDEPVPGEAA